MRRLLWAFGWVAVAVWSLFAFAAYGLVDLVGKGAMRHADSFSADPETVEWIWRMFSFGHGLTTSVILVVWGFVSLAILAVPWLFDRLTAAPAARASRRPDGVIDLSPGDYSVRAPASGSPVPRIGRRG